MRYDEIASELSKMAKQMTELADRLNKIDAVTPYVSELKDNLLVNKITLTVSDACDALSISKTIMYQLIHRDDFPCIRIGRRALIPRDKLIEWVNNHCGEEF